MLRTVSDKYLHIYQLNILARTSSINVATERDERLIPLVDGT
jgi:hypothetical protein